MAIYRNVLEYNLPNGGIAQNIFYANVINGEGADQDDLVEDIGEEIRRIITPWLAQMASNVIATLVRIYVLDPLSGLSTPVGVHSLNLSGLGSVQAMPGPVAVKISQYVAGRSRPFGVFLSGCDESGALNNGNMSLAMQSVALNVGIENTITTTMPLTSLAYRPRVYSAKDQAMFDLTGASTEVNDVFDYQRRRKQGVGV